MYAQKFIDRGKVIFCNSTIMEFSISVAFTYSYEIDSLLLTFTSTFRAANSYSFSMTLIDSLKKRKTTIQNITLH